MKLFGSSKKNKHNQAKKRAQVDVTARSHVQGNISASKKPVASNEGIEVSTNLNNLPTNVGKPKSRKEKRSFDAATFAPNYNTKIDKKPRMSKKSKAVITVCTILGLILVFITSTFAVLRWQIEPIYTLFFRPTVNVMALPPIRPHELDDSERPENINFPDSEESSDSQPPVDENLPAAERRENVLTFLLLGLDLHGNTDVIMVGKFDTNPDSRALNVVSIPRDTLVNVSWNLRKANSIQPVMRNRNRGADNAYVLAMDDTIAEFRNLLGFDLDFWVTVNMHSFPRIVDAIGGVHMNVPTTVSVDGITVHAGQQRLNGAQALTLMRERDYAGGDVTRVHTQQLFLEAAARQLMNANLSATQIANLADVFINNARTDLSVTDLIFFGNEFLRLTSDDVTFATMPGTFESIRGNFYISILLEPWLEMVNERLNPWNVEITPIAVSILTRGPDRRLYVTDGNWAGTDTWGANTLGPANPTNMTGG